MMAAIERYNQVLAAYWAARKEKVMSRMKTMAVVLAATPAWAQDMEGKLKEKLAKPFITKAPWITDYDKAREEATKSGKPIFAYFTRSFSP